MGMSISTRTGTAVHDMYLERVLHRRRGNTKAKKAIETSNKGEQIGNPTTGNEHL